MKRKLFLSLLVLLAYVCTLGQSRIPLRADSVIVEKIGSYADLIVRNITQDSTGGIAVNIGGGVLRYIKPRVISPTQIIIGLDTFDIAGSSGITDTTNLLETKYHFYQVLDSLSSVIGSVSGGDDWGSQTIIADEYLTGTGITGDTLSVNLDSFYTKYQVDDLIAAISVAGGADGSLIAGTDSVAHTVRLKGRGTNSIKLDVDTTLMSTHWYVDSAIAEIATPGLVANSSGVLGNDHSTVPTDLTVKNAIQDAVDNATFSGASLIPGWRVFTDISGVVADGSFTGGSDNSPELNSAISAAADYTKIIIPRGNFRFNSTIIIPTGKHILFENYGNLFFGSNITGFIIDGLEQNFVNYGKIYGRSQSTINYSGLTSVGVYVRNSENSDVFLGFIEGFKYGTRVGGYATGTTVAQGAQFNEIHWKYLRRNSVGLEIHPMGGNGSWSNGNRFYASKIVADTGVIFRPDVTDRPANNVNGNVIYGLWLENGGSPSIQMKLGVYMDFSTSNTFIGGRIEPAPIAKKFYFTSSVYNTGLIGINYIAWQWLADIGNGTYIEGPIWDDVAGVPVGTHAQGYNPSGTNTFYNSRIRIFNTRRSPSAAVNKPANVDWECTNEVDEIASGATHVPGNGIKYVYGTYSFGTQVQTLPTASQNPDRDIWIKNRTSVNTITVVGVASGQDASLGPNETIHYHSDGTQWLTQ